MIRLHHSHETRSMRSLWLLYELGVDFELVVHPFGKNLRSEEYLKLNPAGRVPALEMDGATIFETGAITQVLCERFPQAGLGRAVDDPERADWLIWVHFSETISQHIAALTQQHMVLREDWMRSPTVIKLEAARLAKCYAALEGQLDGRDYLLAGGFSAADVSCGQAVHMGQYFAKLDPYPRVVDWFARLQSREGYKRACPEKNRFFDRDFFEVPE